LDSSDSLKYVLVMADYFSRFTFAFPTKELGWYLVIKAWDLILAILGFPQELFADNAFQKQAMIERYFEKVETVLKHPMVRTIP
jgi:hypothetical protein